MSQLTTPKQNLHHQYEIETIEGLEFITQQELMPFIRKKSLIISHVEKGMIQCSCSNPIILTGLRTAIAVYAYDYYDVPRPKALLGHQHFQRLLRTIQFASKMMPIPPKTFYVSAAGSDSSVMTRIKLEIASTTGCTEAEQGDLFLRIRRAGNGWDVLTRLTERPLATREWRVCNMQGALNAPVAQAMIYLSSPTSNDRFLNVMCGSGTLLIERLNYGAVKSAVGCDINPSALECATQNVARAGYAHHIQLIQSDIVMLPLLADSADVICADLPFGQLVGSHQENVHLYPIWLRKMGRVLAPNGRMVIITHEIKLMQSILSDIKPLNLVAKYQIIQRGLHPCIYVFKK